MAVYDPSRYNEVPTRELLDAAALGFIGVDRRVIESLISRGPAAAADVIAFAKAEDESHRIDISQVVVDLLRHWKPEGALDVYIEVIRRNPEDVGDELIAALLPFREQAVEPLLALYEELGEESGSDIAFLLAGLHVRDQRILDLLLERLQYDTADGAFCLGLYGDVAAKPALEKVLGEIAGAPKTGDEEDDTTELQREIRYALDQLGGPEPDYTPEPFDIFKEYPKADIPALDLLTEEERVEMLGSPDADTRGAAAHTFFNHELSESARRELLKLAESDSEPKVRGYAWASLADITEDKALRDKMIAVVNDTSRDVVERGGAAVGLYGVADKSPATEAIEALYQEGGKARAKALEAMWRSLWKPFSKYFAENLGDKDPAIVRQALRGAGYFQLTSQIEKIASYFNRDEPFDDVREDALFAYALAMPGETTRGRIPGMLRKIDDLAQLDSEEMNVVKFALDERLRLAGKKPVFEEEDEHDPDHHHHEHGPDCDHGHEHAAAPQPAPAVAKVGRNDPCPCGSGKKYKKCHGA